MYASYHDGNLVRNMVTELVVYQRGNVAKTCRMNVKDTRRANLNILLQVHGRKTVAAKVGREPNFITQLRSPKKPFGDAMARLFERAFELGDGGMDRPLGYVLPPTSRPAEISQEGMASRPKNNVKALRFAVQSLFSVLHERMPDVAKAVEQDILETAGTAFAGEGFLRTLVATLQGDPRTEEADTEETQPVRASRA